MPDSPLASFSEATRQWFSGAFAEPTAAQAGAWHQIATGGHSLVVAPTGSGKTLAAFLAALDRLATAPPPEQPQQRCRVLYVSPLKALAMDVERNLRAPLTGIRQATQRLGGQPPEIQVGMRTGDTPAEERRAFLRRPPDVLVTTPESLFLLLTSASKESLRGVQTVILDEIHAVAGTKRGAHLALSLERLDQLLPAPAQRIGLSATVRPVEEVTSFLAGGRPVAVVAPEHGKEVSVRVEVPVQDMSRLGEPTGEQEGSAAGAEQRSSIWPAVEQRVLALAAEQRSTIVFANSRRLAERLTARLNELAGTESGQDPALATPTRFPAEAVGGSGIAHGQAEGAEGAVVAKAHHGSMSRTQRTQVEEELKSGQLPCVVATSSLELGIDMGAVDLVVQVEAPPSVSSGLQRVGRAGHHVGAASFGVVFPKFRGDLVSCAVVAERMRAGAIESLSYPRNPLDVLAQQVVAMVALEDWPVHELATLVRKAAPFASLPDSALTAVLDMLSGRYPSEEFGELRPRIVWDRHADLLHGRPGAQRLAVTSGGTIPDRGLFTVTTPASEAGPGSRVGELDEEMVYESRVGDTFLLGSTAWRVEDISHDRVTVLPAPGQPARMPFWKGDAPGRPLELGRAHGAFVRELGAMNDEDAGRRATDAGLDSWAVDNLLAYLREQREATGHVPSDKTLLIERFRDELGDWRLVVHSPFGGQVNGPWALAITARLREQRGVEAHVASADDGIVIRLPDAIDDDGSEVLPSAEDVLLDPDQIEEVLLGELANSALFAARFRECAARSLLLPRRDPRRRTPLWQQRQRAAQLLSVAANYDQFPVILETMRECLQDVYDVPGLTQLLREVASRSVRVVEVATDTPSPFARSLLFGYVGMFLYELDAPLAERRAAALSLDSSVLAELLGSEAIRELLDPEVIAEVEAQLQRLDPQRQPAGPEQAADALRALGDLSTEEGKERGIRAEWLQRLEDQRRVLSVRIAGDTRWIPVEDAGTVRDGLGTALPVGVPEAFTEPVADPLSELLIRFARTRGPFSASAAAQRFGIGVAVAGGVLDRLTGSGRLVRGELRPGGEGTEYCDAEILRRIRRGSLARLRAEVEPVDQATLGRFLPQWHGIGARPGRGPGAEDVLAVVEQLAGAPVPASALESLILPARLPGYSSALLDELTTTGEVVWTGCGTLAGADGWLSLAPADLADLVLPEPEEEPPDSALHRALLGSVGQGAWFFRQLADAAGQRLAEEQEPAASDEQVTRALWDLVWAGLLTNDTLAPLRALLAPGPRGGKAGAGGAAGSGRTAAHRGRARAPRGRYASLRSAAAGPGGTRRPGLPARGGPASAAGRWSAVVPRSGMAGGEHAAGTSDEEASTRRAHARAETFLERHGVLTRGALEAERVRGGFSAVYRVLRAMEDSGRCRRGYVVEGLGAAQFAVPGAIDRLRSFGAEPSMHEGDEPAGTAVLLAATDPAQPYGAALPWPSSTAPDAARNSPAGSDPASNGPASNGPASNGPASNGAGRGGTHKPGRKAGALVVLVAGRPVLYVERGGRTMLSFTTEDTQLHAAARALADGVATGVLAGLSVERTDGVSALGGHLAETLQAVGFRSTPKGLRLRS